MDYSLDGGASWHPARLEGPNIPGAWARWRFAWDAKPGNHEVRARATDESGVVQPHETPWNRLGYLFDGIVGHPVRVH